MRNLPTLLVSIIFVLMSCDNSSEINESNATSFTKIIAHRGYSGVAPENTMVAFQKAIECGADYIELDVHKSIDNIPVVIHDYTVDRTSSNHSTGHINKMTAEELSTIKVGYPSKFGDQYSDQNIPNLREVLQLAKGKIKVCIEIKVHGIEEEVLNIINELNMQEEVIVFSFKYEVLIRMRSLNSKIPILFLIDYADAGTIEYAKLVNAQAIGVGYATKPNKELLSQAHKNGIEIWKWTVDEEEQMASLIDLGLDGIITNYPKKALSLRN